VRQVLLFTILLGCDRRADPRTFVPCAETAFRDGEATFYEADGTGKCSFDPVAAPALVAAIDDADYADAALCGACVEVRGPRGRVTVRIVDRCPGCKPGGLDLSEAAFARVADPVDGRVPVQWRVVRCQVGGPLRYRWKDGSSAGWAALQVRDHPWPVARLEVRPPGRDWRQLPRTDYNYFLAEGGLGEATVDVRITDSWGASVDDVTAFGDDVERAGFAQLPGCAQSGSQMK
jgi:expansin (peptidoglycan-binding protein)